MDHMSFDLSWDTLAVLKCGMRIRYSGADPTRNSGCTEPCCILNKQAASAIPQLGSWALSHASMIVSEHSYWAIRSTKICLTSWDLWDVPWVIDFFQLKPQLGAKLFSGSNA